MIRRAIVLAAGKGTRMKSARPKVLHNLCGREMLWYTLRALRDAQVSEIIIVANSMVAEHVESLAADLGIAHVKTVIQEPQLGTGHAVQTALHAMEPGNARIVVLNADMPLIDEELIRRVIGIDNAVLALATVRMPVTSNFGRIVRMGDQVTHIVEVRDASEEERALDEMNVGLYGFDESRLRASVADLSPENAQNEYYLTDTVKWLSARNERVVAVKVDDARVVLGINDRVELAIARAHLNALLCERHQRAGVTIVDPATTYLEPDLEIAADVTILPNTVIHRGTRIGAHSEIGPNTRLQNATIGEHVTICDSVVVDSTIGNFSVVGPWAHLRGWTELGTGVSIGNFVEAKNSTFASGVKARHLSYLGDTTIGARTNVGAGTITCNYDGKKKHRTEIGEDVFIGSNSSLVAPLHIGDRALTGAGSVVVRDLPADERVAGNPARSLVPKNGKDRKKTAAVE